MKRLICALLTAAMLAFAPAAALAETPDTTAADAAALLRSDGSDLSMDLTGNGTVDAVDAQAALLVAMGLMDDPSILPAILSDSLLGEAYLDKFSYNGVVSTGGGNYRSGTLSCTVTKHTATIENRKVTYFVGDIYLRNLSCFRTAFAEDTYLRSDPVERMAADVNAILAISGDYYNQRKRGVVIRNGELYRGTVDKNRDVCVLYADGTMETYEPKQVDVDAFLARGAYQSWGFGPGLLDENGQPKTKFNSRVAARNPRSVVGYYEPGHYCFVVVDGRLQGYSFGINMTELSKLMNSFGCKAAYNLDGGATAVMATADGMINHQTDRNRECSDILYLIDTDEKLEIKPSVTLTPEPAATPEAGQTPEAAGDGADAPQDAPEAEA